MHQAGRLTAPLMSNVDGLLWAGIRLLQSKVERQLCGLTRLRHVSGTKQSYSHYYSITTKVIEGEYKIPLVLFSLLFYKFRIIP